MASFNFSSSKSGDITIVKLSGELDAHSAPEFEKKITPIVSESGAKVVIDFSSLDYIATAGLGALMASATTIKNNNGKMVLAGMSDKIKKVFQVMGFINVFQIFSSVDEAVKSF